MTVRRKQMRKARPGATREYWPRLAMLAALAVMTGACGRGLFSGSSSGSSSGGGVNGTTRSVYVTNFADGKLSSLSNTGGVPASPVAIGAGQANGPLGLAAVPSLSALYVANAADNLIHEFTINLTGNLSTMATIAAGTNPQQVIVTPNDSFGYAINSGGSISQYSLGTTTGALTSNGSTTSGLVAPVSGVASDAFVYVTDPAGGAGNVLSFTINSNGTLAAPGVISLGATATNPGQITLDTTGAWVIVADTASGVISVLQVVTGGLSFTSQTTTTGSKAAGVVFATTPSGFSFIYVANPTLGTITVFSFSVGFLTQLSAQTVTGLSSPTGVAVDDPFSATVLFATNAGTGTISGFTINATSGTLAPTLSSATQSPPNANSSPEFILVSGNG